MEKCSHWTTILLPIPIPPLSNGWEFEKIDGWEAHALAEEEELTDEEQVSEDDS